MQMPKGECRDSRLNAGCPLDPGGLHLLEMSVRSRMRSRGEPRRRCTVLRSKNIVRCERSCPDCWQMSARVHCVNRLNKAAMKRES